MKKYIFILFIWNFQKLRREKFHAQFASKIRRDNYDNI